MDNNSGFMGALYTLSEWVMKFSITNLLWILFNLPIVYLLFTILFVEQLEVVFFLLIPSFYYYHLYSSRNDSNVRDGARLDY